MAIHTPGHQIHQVLVLHHQIRLLVQVLIQLIILLKQLQLQIAIKMIQL